jgi:hypothetical protein
VKPDDSVPVLEQHGACLKDRMGNKWWRMLVGCIKLLIVCSSRVTALATRWESHERFAGMYQDVNWTGDHKRGSQETKRWSLNCA